MNSHRSGPWPLRKDDTQLGIRHLVQEKGRGVGFGFSSGFFGEGPFSRGFLRLEAVTSYLGVAVPRLGPRSPLSSRGYEPKQWLRC